MAGGVTNGEIIQLLCDSIIAPLKLEIGDNFYNKPAVASRIINCREHGELPKILKEKANDKAVLASIDDYFRKNVAWRIYPQKVDGVIAIIKEAIIADYILSQEQKDQLCNLAAKETLGPFLAQVFLHVIGRENAIKENKAQDMDEEESQMPTNITYSGSNFSNSIFNGTVVTGDHAHVTINTGTRQEKMQPVQLSEEHYNLFVVESEDFMDGKFSIPSSDCLRNGTVKELREKLCGLGSEEIRQVCSLPALFMAACESGMEDKSNAAALFGRVTSLAVCGLNIKIACIIDPNITIPDKALIEKRNELGIEFGGVGNEFSTQHWAVKQKNIFEIMADVVELPRSI